MCVLKDFTDRFNFNVCLPNQVNSLFNFFFLYQGQKAKQTEHRSPLSSRPVASLVIDRYSKINTRKLSLEIEKEIVREVAKSDKHYLRKSAEARHISVCWADRTSSDLCFAISRYFFDGKKDSAAIQLVICFPLFNHLRQNKECDRFWQRRMWTHHKFQRHNGNQLRVAEWRESILREEKCQLIASATMVTSLPSFSLSLSLSACLSVCLSLSLSLSLSLTHTHTHLTRNTPSAFALGIP